MIKAYKCKKCDYQTTVRGWRNAQNEIEGHFKEKHNIADIVGKDLVESIESEPTKKWKCPLCEKKMWYGAEKHWHQSNATRAGKPYACIPK